MENETATQLDLFEYTGSVQSSNALLVINKRLRGFIKAEDSLLKDLELKEPVRATKGSAGYDFFNNTGSDLIIPPNSTSKKISTGFIAYMEPGVVLKVYGRSGHGFNYSSRLANSTGIIDSDYNKEIFLKIRNPYNEELVIPKGESMAQGIFVYHLLADGDSFDNGATRVGGLGSTSIKAQ